MAMDACIREEIRDWKRPFGPSSPDLALHGPFLESLLDAIPDLFFLKDPEGRYLGCNRAFAERVGLGKSAIVGRTDDDLYPPEEAQWHRHHDRLVLSGKEPLSSENWISYPDGRRVLMETCTTLHRGPDGQLLGIIGVSRDVTGRKQVEEQSQQMACELQQMVAERTVELVKANRGLQQEIIERKRIEQALRESEERFSAFMANLPAAAFVKDAAGRTLFVNPYLQQLLNFRDWEGKTTPELVAGEMGLQMDKDDREALGQGPLKIRETMRDSLGAERTFETIKFPIRIEGKPTALGGVSFDITERLKLEERLHRSEKMEALGQLAGGVAHDLNNVLGVSMAYSELLREKVPDGSPLRAYVEHILASIEKGAAIVQDLLTLARRGVSASRVIDLNDAVASTLRSPEFERLQAHHPLVPFRLELDKELLHTNGSPVHLEKTLFNLLSNAAEAISGPGEVVIRTQNRYLDHPVQGYDEVKEGDYAVLTVSDNGGGIGPADLNKIFEPFYTKKTMGHSGTGLGLTIVWGTVKDHDGYIDVQSAEGRGSTFTLYFPVTRERITEEATRIPVEQYLGHGESVLVVDDVAEQRQVATAMLTRLGYRVNAVSGGEEAVAHLRQNPADLLVLDMIMTPGIDGLETYRRVRELRPGQKAVIVSGFSETERVKEAQKLGAGVYVRKPYLMEKIGVAVRQELNRT